MQSSASSRKIQIQFSLLIWFRNAEQSEAEGMEIFDKFSTFMMHESSNIVAKERKG